MKRELRQNIPIRIICALLFCTFSFLYIYVLHGERLALMQDYLAKGMTTNNTLITASIITLLLLALQWLLNRVGSLHGKYEAISYLPSCVLLALVTKLDSSLAYSWSQWLIAMGLVVLLYVLFVWLERNSLQPRGAGFLFLLTPNLGMLALLFVFTGTYSNDVPVEQMELTAWKYTHSRQYDKVLKVGERSMECSIELAALRNLALVKTGQLGEKLFAYPQPYGSAGLMMNRYNLQTTSYGAKEFYELLDAQPYGGESATAFYKRMAMKNDADIYRALYKSALLLDKDLETFAMQTISDGALTGVPVYYQEAWIIYNEQHPFTSIPFEPDEDVARRYEEYLALREANVDNSVVMQNLCRRKFGKTYWYYYDFVNK